MANIDKLNELASNKSNWLEKAKNRQKNKEWLKHSQKIAIKVLRTLREKKIKQKQLAVMIGVSPQYVNKIVKGKENLTLDTISKLEQALGIKLIFSEKNIQIIKKEYNIKKEYVYMLPVYKSEDAVAIQKPNYSFENVMRQNLVNEEISNYEC